MARVSKVRRILILLMTVGIASVAVAKVDLSALPSRETEGGLTGNFRLQKDVYLVGEPIFARFEVVNRGQVPFPFVEFGASYYQFSTAVRNKEGRDFTKPLPGYLTGFVTTISLKPRGERYVRDVLVSSRARLLPPGDYVVEISRTLEHRALDRILESARIVESDSEPSGEAASVTVEARLHFRVKAYEPNELKKCLAVLAREDHEARQGVRRVFGWNVNGALLDVSQKLNMGLSSATEGLREEVIKNLPQKWDDKYYLEALIDFNRNWLTGSDPEEYILTFTITNNSNKTLESGVLGSSVYVDGKEIKDWKNILSEVLKGNEAKYIAAGATLKFSHRFNRYVKGKGRHEIVWQLNYVTSAKTSVNVKDDRA
jgi:hypothetical protein